MKRTFIACLSLCLALAAQAEIRVWKDASGAHEIKAELVSVQGGKVTLKRENGTTDPSRRQPQQGRPGAARWRQQRLCPGRLATMAWPEPR